MSDAGYDSDNVFARILRDEIPANKVLETEHALAFHDVSPQAPVHVLVIPKGPYATLDDFMRSADLAQQTGLLAAINMVVGQLGLAEGGYRVLANNGAAARQEVPHLHFHVLAGRDLGGLLPS